MTKFLFILFSFLIANLSLGIEFSEYSVDQKFQLYKGSCESGEMANCFQVGIWYKTNLRLDTEEVRAIRSTMDNLKEKKKNLKSADENSELTEDEENEYNQAKLNLAAETQKNTALLRYKEYMQKACSGGAEVACDELLGKNKQEATGLLYYTSLILIGFATFLIAKTIFQDEETFQAQEKLDDNKNVAEIAKHGIILQYSRPFFKRFFSPVVSGMKNKKIFKEKYKRPLASSGLTNILTPEDFFAFKLFLILGFPIVFLALKIFMEADWDLMYMPILALVGFFYPDIWINGKIEERQKEIVRNMPFSVDMLALSVEAGLDFVAAMSKVNEKAKPNPLSEEFENVIKEIRIGASRAEALRNLAWRVNLIQISSFCATLIAADSVGASIGPILKSLSNEIRQKKSAEVEKAGATAATKILFPMIFLIIPSVLLIVFSPIVMEFIGGK